MRLVSTSRLRLRPSKEQFRDSRPRLRLCKCLRRDRDESLVSSRSEKWSRLIVSPTPGGKCLTKTLHVKSSTGKCFTQTLHKKSNSGKNLFHFQVYENSFKDIFTSKQSHRRETISLSSVWMTKKVF